MCHEPDCWSQGECWLKLCVGVHIWSDQDAFMPCLFTWKTSCKPKISLWSCLNVGPYSLDNLALVTLRDWALLAQTWDIWFKKKKSILKKVGALKIANSRLLKIKIHYVTVCAWHQHGALGFCALYVAFICVWNAPLCQTTKLLKLLSNLLKTFRKF